MKRKNANPPLLLSFSFPSSSSSLSSSRKRKKANEKPLRSYDERRSGDCIAAMKGQGDRVE
jgi:hypothetical protein